MNGKHVKSNSISKGKPFYSQQHSHRSQSAKLVNTADDNMNKPSKRDSVAASSIKNITGALVDGHVVNQVMLQNQPMGTSKFDPNLENDFSADEITLLFETGRLAQFQEDY